MKLWSFGKTAFKGLTLTLLATAIALSLASLTPRFWTASSPCRGAVSDTIYVVNHGYHTGLIVEVTSAFRQWDTLLDSFSPTPEFLEFGWGDRSFYTAGEETIGLGLRALFLPTEAVLHSLALYGHPQTIYRPDAIRAIPVCATKYPALLQYIDESFALNQHQQIQFLQQGLFGESSAFHAAKGSYHLLYTCNSWVASALQHVEITTPLWAGLAQSVMWHLPEQ